MTARREGTAGARGISGRIVGGKSLVWRDYSGDFGPDGTRAEIFKDWRRDPRGYARCYVFTIETRPELRGQGRATALLERICLDADRDEVLLFLLPLPDDAACLPRLRAWYARHGFRDLPPDARGLVGMAREPRVRVRV
jgi:GNAT superfamily N-acetyltransferase